MSNKIDVVKFTFRKEWRALNDAVTGKYNDEQFSAATDLVSYLSGQQASLIFASLQEKDDLIQLATLVKLAKKGAKDTIMKIVVVNFAGNKQFEKAIAKLGILDVVDPYINTKALRFKIDFYMKSLNGQMKNSKQSEMNVRSMDQNRKSGEDAKKRTDAANWLDPMDCEDDIWLLKKDADCKKVLGRWLVRLMGPSPAAGQWVEVKGKNNAWKFELKPEAIETFINGKGTWYFQGDQKPEFVWKENSWLITGSSFELFYHVDGKKQTRLKLKDKILEICKNSEYAKTKEAAIVESCDKELVFKKEAEKAAGKDEIEGNETDWLKDLHGKGSTDHIENGNLEGDNDSSLDKLNSDPMGLDLEPGDNNLGDGNMSGKNGGAEDLGGNYDGKSSTDKLDKKGHSGPAGDKLPEGGPLGMDVSGQEHKDKYKGHNEAEEFDAKDGLLTASGEKHRDGALLDMEATHADHKTKYKGHNEAEVFEEGELGKHQYHEEGKGPLGGKSNTDHIPKFYNKDGSKPDRPLTPEEQAESDAYEGKSKTDKLSSHYGRGEEKSESAAKEAKARERAEKEARGQKDSDEPDFDDEIGNDPYGGSSSTDKLKSHYGGKKSAVVEEADDGEDDIFQKEKKAKVAKKSQLTEDDLFEDSGDYGGASSTDKMASHYKSSSHKRADAEDSESSEDVFARKKKDRSDDFSESDSEDMFARSSKKKYEDEEDNGSDLFDTMESKKKRSGSSEMGGNSSDDDGFSDAIRNNQQYESESDSDFDSLEDDDKVISIEQARNSKKKKAPAPLVSDKEIDKDLKEMMEEATITARLIQNKFELVCVLDDFFETNIIFISNKPGFNSHDPVTLDLSFKYMKKVTNLKFDGKILSIDPMEGNISYLTVVIGEEKIEEVNAFMQLYQQRQQNIDAFLKRVKGI